MANKSIFNWRLLATIFLLISIISGGATYYFKIFKLREGKTFTIDPEVEIDPNQEYQITYWDYPLFIGQKDRYEEFLKKSIKEFNTLYPNIKVSYRLLSFVKGEDLLYQSLESGKPPDIYNNIYGSRLINEELQIPINLFWVPSSKEKEENIVKNDKDKYDNLALEALTYKEKIWGLPNWLLPQFWVGNKRVLKKSNLDINKIAQQGWTWEEFKDYSLKLKEKDYSIIFNPYNSDLFYQLLAANNKNIVSNEGKLLLNQKILTNIFENLNKLKENKVFPQRVTKMNKRLLPDFWQGKAAIIAPINMWLLNNLYQKDSKVSRVEMILLSIPNSSDYKSSLKVSSLLLFRQQAYKGDDHSKAVYEFAKFINQEKNQIISQRLKVLPAYLPLQEQWKREVKLKEEIKDQLILTSNSSRITSLTSSKNLILENKIKEIIDQNYKNFWLKNLTVDEIVQDILTSSQNLIDINKKQSQEK
ncbi:ABC transporter substrate-binding protein [Orenia marismortui]|uniref:Carbohydrate ABC transporter substrate-binding protein (CUT1 family) n=1 Tax=Orenia marismortui TaxID=46469 RepID=A0A4R8H8S1_9FIRM|nr:extracellular solute-binding protein [Orenia marismortui]TDX52306.1 carbohydrate ABC transporter substrate-binding protein (CUT1 family) [Orenia marismortui]